MIVVIGGGPAGRYAAMRLAGAGREVRLIERRREGLGGQCLHQGCMVICALNDVARTMEHLEILHRSGVITSVPKIAYPALISRMQEIIGTIARVIDEETRTAGVSVIQGDARVEGRSVLINAERLEPEAIIIATGTRPRQLHIPGEELPGVMTAHTIFSLSTLPSRLVIIGGGVIAAEMAYLFSLFGSTVTILARSSLLKEFPPTLIKEARKELHRVTIREYVQVIRITGETRVSGVEAETPEGSMTIEADAILIAAGTEPEIGSVQGIPLGEDGFIRVNHRMETGIPGVFAVGDVTGTSELTPAARWQGRAAADVILGLEPAAPLDTIPQAIKLRNDLAFCGVQDEGGMKVTIPSPAGPGSFWAIPDRATGRASMTADPDSGRILGMLEASP